MCQVQHSEAECKVGNILACNDALIMDTIDVPECTCSDSRSWSSSMMQDMFSGIAAKVALLCEALLDFLDSDWRPLKL